MNKSWSENYWFVIESIVSQTQQLNNSQSLETLKLLGNYLPCQDCRNHYNLFITNNTYIDTEWLNKLKREIKLNSRKKLPGCCKK